MQWRAKHSVHLVKGPEEQEQVKEQETVVLE